MPLSLHLWEIHVYYLTHQFVSLPRSPAYASKTVQTQCKPSNHYSLHKSKHSDRGCDISKINPLLSNTPLKGFLAPKKIVRDNICHKHSCQEENLFRRSFSENFQHSNGSFFLFFLSLDVDLKDSTPFDRVGEKGTGLVLLMGHFSEMSERNSGQL